MKSLRIPVADVMTRDLLIVQPSDHLDKVRDIFAVNNRLVTRGITSQHLKKYNTMPVLNADLQVLHFEHKTWVNELEFIEGELNFFENRLSDLVMRYREVEVLAKLEQFQNQFIRQKEVLDKLLRDIRVHEQTISSRLQKELEVPDRFLDEHSELRNRMASYRKIYGEIKTGFFQFLAKWIG